MWEEGSRVGEKRLNCYIVSTFRIVVYIFKKINC
jgi:hypothetical protein